MITVDTTVFKSNLRRYAVISGKSIFDAVKEESKIVAQKLTAITPPKSAKQGKVRVKSDIERVYLKSQWFTETFSFKNEKLGEKVKQAVRKKAAEILNTLFDRSPKLNRIHIESFDESIHARFRKKGRVPKGVAPFSYPLTDQSKVTAYVKQKETRVGSVKSGWAYCVKVLGGSVAKWVDKGNNGTVIKEEKESTVTLINNVPYASEFMGSYKFVLGNRERDLAKKTDNALKRVKW